MNSRTPLLLGVMVLMVAAWVGDQFGLLDFLDGNSEGGSELDKISRQIAKAEEIILQGAGAGKQVEEFEQRSLPYDSAAARSAYQSWLTKLVEENRIQKSTVEVSKPTSINIKDGDGKRREAYKRYAFTVNGAASLSDITKFLYAFYQTGHLHKITSLKVTPNAASMFNLSVVGEALGITTCDRKSELASSVGNLLAHDELADYSLIVRRNIFSREGASTLKLVRLSSITYDKSGQPEAWFQLGKAQAVSRRQRNEEIKLAMHSIRVIDIQPQSVLLEVDGQILELSMGQTIAERLHDADLEALPAES